MNYFKKDGAFDEAVRGVEGIVHTAAMVSTILDHIEPKGACACEAIFVSVVDGVSEIIDPAVQGNIGLLTSAQKYGYVPGSTCAPNIIHCDHVSSLTIDL